MYFYKGMRNSINNNLELCYYFLIFQYNIYIFKLFQFKIYIQEI